MNMKVPIWSSEHRELIDQGCFSLYMTSGKTSVLFVLQCHHLCVSLLFHCVEMKRCSFVRVMFINPVKHIAEATCLYKCPVCYLKTCQCVLHNTVCTTSSCITKIQNFLAKSHFLSDLYYSPYPGDIVRVPKFSETAYLIFLVAQFASLVWPLLLDLICRKENAVQHAWQGKL